MMTVKELKEYLTDKDDDAIVTFGFRQIEIRYLTPEEEQEIKRESEKKHVRKKVTREV